MMGPVRSRASHKRRGPRFPGGALIQWVLENAHMDALEASREVQQKLASMSHDFFKTEMLADRALAERIDEVWEAMLSRVRDALTKLLDKHALRGEPS